MSSTRRRFVMPLVAALMLGLLAIGVTACGSGNPREVEEGEVVKVGGLKYTVVFSRYLNENDNEDAAYLKGQEPIAERTQLLRRLPPGVQPEPQLLHRGSRR